jgi:hypothetical protein
MGWHLAGWRGGAGGGASQGRKHDEVDGSRSSERKRELRDAVVLERSLLALAARLGRSEGIR